MPYDGDTPWFRPYIAAARCLAHLRCRPLSFPRLQADTATIRADAFICRYRAIFPSFDDIIQTATPVRLLTAQLYAIDEGDEAHRTAMSLL